MLGENNILRQARIEKGRSAKEVAEAVHVTYKSIYRYEEGTRAPNVYTALRLSDYYNMPVTKLFHVNDWQEGEHEKGESADEH